VTDGRRRVAALAGAVLAVAATLAAEWQAAGAARRELALRTATTTAAYLSLVTPVARDTPPSLDARKLLIAVRALEALPGWTPTFEVYQGTAPLVHGTAAPLPLLELLRLRFEGPRWTGGVARAPLTLPGDRHAVGAVEVRAPSGRGAPGTLTAFICFATLAAAARVATAARNAARRALLIYAASSVVLGIAAYRDVWQARRSATDRWLADTRHLIQEAAARSPKRLSRITTVDFATLTAGAALVRTDSAGSLPRRRRWGGETWAAVTARIGPGRWMELRTAAGEDGTGAWLPLLVGVALLGPLSGLARHYHRDGAVVQQSGP